MKITIKQYAQSLYETISQMESGGDIKAAIKNFVKILATRNELGKASDITHEFTKIWNKEQGIVEGELVSARELSEEIKTLLNGQIVKLLKIKEIRLESIVDQDILGGFVVKMDDMVIDGSIKHQLINLKNKIVNQ